MQTFIFDRAKADIDFSAGEISSLVYDGTELLRGHTPLFKLCLRDEQGAQVLLDSHGGVLIEEKKGIGVYAFACGVTVTVTATAMGDALLWHGRIENHTDLTAEWLEMPRVSLAPLAGEGGSASMLYPYNEGAIVDSVEVRQKSWFPSREIEYPSLGAYPVFPNMICSQFMAYLWENHGLYMGAHDPDRGVKGIDFSAGDGGGVEVRFRFYCGARRGEDYDTDFAILWRFFEGTWETAAELYREWFESCLPPRVCKIRENPALPEWYEDAPLIVSYPVRGIHDMDEMKPNALFPYMNAMPVLDEIRAAVKSRLLVLLMHWEGTAPWAPPTVCPPFGGWECFNAFRDALHAAGDMLGVYCSGFGYTVQSNLIKEYNNEEKFEREHLADAMCAAPDGVVRKSRICTGQRAGYDLCPASPAAKTILDEAYRPLLTSGVDYAQILDQNHGGGQYFCYSKKHGHPPVPGAWMTAEMQKLLTGWNEMAGKTLFGCESASAEPFMGNLLFSDNRYELNWHIGKPVPLYAYLYHEYLRNFMGNQVSTPFAPTENTFYFRLGYAFAAGDCMTIVLTPDGRCLDQWGGRDFTHLPDKGEILAFAANLAKFYRGEAHDFLYRGRMVAPLPVECPADDYQSRTHTVSVPRVFTTAWEADGRRAQIFVNHTKEAVECTVGGKKLTVPARDAVLLSL